MILPENLTGKALYDHLVANKALLLASKKSSMKQADGFLVSKVFSTNKAAVESVPDAATELDTSLVINTTNWFDSHKDVHIPGLWKKNLAEVKDIFLLKEHNMSFESVISDEIAASTKNIMWAELGYAAQGFTEALVFDTKILKARNPYMFDQYRQKFVRNHSVGMIYVKIELAINDEDYKEEFAVWNKYIDQIINADDATAEGYFWAVKEAKVVEGSAVLKGSNAITPIYSMSSTKHSTENAAAPGTDAQPLPEVADYDKIAEKFLQL